MTRIISKIKSDVIARTAKDRDFVTTNSLANTTLGQSEPAYEIGRFSNRTGTSVDDGARKSNNWLDQWQSGKLAAKVTFSPFPRAFPSCDVPVLLLNRDQTIRQRRRP